MYTRILAMDTTTEYCSVAIFNNGEVHTLFELCKSGHTQHILLMVKNLLSYSGITAYNLDALFFCRGPGNFTGVRISMSIAQGLSLGAYFPIIGISSLLTMAQGAWRVSGESRVIAAIDARIGEVYWRNLEINKDPGFFSMEQEYVFSPMHTVDLSRKMIGKWAYVGTGWKNYKNIVKGSMLNIHNGNILFPQAQDILPLTLLYFHNTFEVIIEHSNPIYLRN